MLKTFETFYAKKEYSNALQTLQKLKSEMDLTMWHYNMGTVLAKLENWPEARYHLLMAEKLGLSTKNVSQNKEIIESKLEINKLEKPLSFTDYAIEVGEYSSKGLLTTLSLIFLIIGLIKLKRKHNYKSLFFFLLLVLSPLILNFWIKTWTFAVTMVPQSIQDGPSVIFPSRGELPAGVRIMTRKSGDWEEVFYPSRFKGWTKKDGMKFLE